MRKTLRFAFTILPAALLVAACGSSNKTSSTPASAPNTASSSSSSGVALATRSIKGLGTVLVDGSGRTLYTFAPDKAKKVTCTGSCATVWPPLKIGAGQKPSLSGGVKASLVSSAPDPSGGQVVTYNGWPLYLYQVDQLAGSDHGQGLSSGGGTWYTIESSGNQITRHIKQHTGPTGY